MKTVGQPTSQPTPMRVLFSTGSPANYMRPPVLGDEQIVCGPDWIDATAPDCRVISLATPCGDYDLAAVAERLPADQAPDVVVCLVDASWRNTPRNLAAFSCPKVLLIADTHHLNSPLIGMLRYVADQPFDRVVFLYDRHHAAFFQAAGCNNVHWFPGLTFPHTDAAVRAARSKGARAARIGFVGQAGKYHPRRALLLEALAQRKVRVEAKALSQADALGFYGSSLLGFNASLNGDLNLRVFEILASGAALLTDRLAPASGLEQLFADRRDCLLYGSAEELAERAEHALAHPRETKLIGAAGARWFDEHFNEDHRRAAFSALAFDGVSLPEFEFSFEEKTRVFFGGDTDRLLKSLMVYEGVQEIHRTEETVRVQLVADEFPDIAQIFNTLPRVDLKPAAERATADLAVFSYENAVAGVRTNASMLWCWDADESDHAELIRFYSPFGYALPSSDVALLCHQGPAKGETSAPANTSLARHILVYTDDATGGGVAQYNHTLLGGLVRAGYRVSSVQSRSDNPMVAEQRGLGVTHHWLDYDTNKEFARTVTDAAPARAIFEREHPDLIIFSDCCPVSNLAARATALQMDIPYMVVVGFAAPYLAVNFSAQLPALAQQYDRARAVVAVSGENLQLLEQHFGLPAGRGRLIHYGRPEKFFAPRDEAVRARLRAELNLPADAVVALTAARLTAVKGYGYQLEAISRLLAEPAAKALHFVWAGDGDQRATLASEIKRRGLTGRVHVLGHRWDVADWYDAADIFVLPSQLEGMPLAIMEAMAKGLPVIATAVSGIPEELGDTGRLLPNPALNATGVVRDLAATLLDWTANPARREAIGQRGRARAQAMFREELMLQRTLDLLQQDLTPAGTTALAEALA